MNRILAGAVLLLLVLPAAATAGQEPLESLIQRLLAAREEKAHKAIIEDILALQPDVNEVLRLLKRGRTYSGDVETGWQRFANPCRDDVKRPYLVWIPESYDPARRYPLLVEMHGGVSRPRLVPDRYFKNLEGNCGKLAQMHDFILMIPKGQQGAEWWTDVGAHNILDSIASLGRTYNIDENRIFATGFSDGGSGAYYLGLTHPTVFAGFIPLNGLVAVAQAGGLQVHLRNLCNRPLYAVNTGRDTLYPAAMVTPIIEAMKKAGVNVTYVVHEDMPHRPDYMEAERPRIWKWMQGVRRDPCSKSLVWETADVKYGRVQWLAVTDLGRGGARDAFPDLNPGITRGRVVLGVRLDRNFEGVGVRIESVSNPSLASTLGLEAGDVITGLDEVDVLDLSDLRGVLGKKKPGEAVKVLVEREGKELSFSGAFPRARPRPALRRSRPYGSIRAVVEGNTIRVTSRNVRAFEVELSPGMFDLAKPVEILVNGKRVSNEVHAPEVRILLECAVRDDDRTALYVGRVRIRVPG